MTATGWPFGFTSSARADRAPGHRVDAEELEVASRDQLSFGRWFDAAVDADVESGGAVGGHVDEHRIRGAQALEFRILEPAGASVGLLGKHQLQPGRIIDRQHAEQDRVDEAEDRGVGADAERQRR